MIMRERSKATKWFMGAIGVIMGFLAVAFPTVTLLQGIGILKVTELPWGFWSGLWGMLFSGLISVEMFTGKILEVSSGILKALAERFTGSSS